MFAKTLAAIAAAAVLSTAITSQSFADMGGGSGEPEATAYSTDGSSINSRRNRDGSRTVTARDRNGNVVNQRVVAKPAKPAKKPRKQDLASASSTDPASGVTISVQQNRDGSRTITERDRNGNVMRQRVEPKPLKKAKAPRKPGRAWASAYDPATGTRVTSIDNGDRTRTVITFGPFGIGIGISR
jgi:hypothetical protein